MKVTVILHTILKEKLPPEAKGRTILELSEGASIKNAMTRLDLSGSLFFLVNDDLKESSDYTLKDGDTLRFLQPPRGG